MTDMMSLKIFYVQLGYDEEFFLDRQKAVEKYNNSGESDKVMRTYFITVTPELVLSLMNTSFETTQMYFPAFIKHVVSDISFQIK